MRTPLLSSSKSSVALLHFVYGEADPQYPETSTPVDIYVNIGVDPVWWEGKKYLPVPNVGVDLPPRSGSLEEDPCVVTLPSTVRQHTTLQSMVRALATPRSPYPVSVTITQLLQSSASAIEPRILYRGKMHTIVRNPQGKKDQISVEFFPDFKMRMEDLTLGRRADATCDAPFGLACGAVTSKIPLFGAGEYYTGVVGPGAPHYQLKRNARIILSLDPDQPRLVTFSIDPAYHASLPAEPLATRTLTQQPSTWWIKSLLCRNGLYIPIAEWRWGDISQPWGLNQFILHRLPPSDWDGASVLLRLDCPRTREACVHRGNEDNFAGLGAEIPAYNPVFEQAES